MLLFFIVSAGFLLRIHDLDKYSFWFDEACQIIFAKEFFPVSLFSVVLERTVSPFSTAFFHFWGYLGNSEFILRLPPLVLGILSIVMLYKVAKELAGPRAGLISAFLLAISPFHVLYSQEATQYAALSLFSLLSIYFFIVFLKEGGFSSGAGYLIFNILNIYNHPAAFLLLLAEIIYFLIYARQYAPLVKKWLLINGLVLVLVAPKFIHVLFTLSEQNLEALLPASLRIRWVPGTPSAASLYWTFKNFSAGYNAGGALHWLMTVFYLVLFTFGAIKLKNRRYLTLVLLLVFFPVFAAFFISQFRSFYVDRYFIASSLFYYLLVANGLARVRKPLVAGALSIILFSAAVGLKNYYANIFPGTEESRTGCHPRKDHRGAVEYIIKNRQADEPVLHVCRSTMAPFRYYFKFGYGLKNVPKELIVSFSGSKEDMLFYEYLQPAFKRCTDQEAMMIGESKRFFLILSSWEAAAPDGPESSIVRRFERRYKKIDRGEFEGISVCLFGLKK